MEAHSPNSESREDALQKAKSFFLCVIRVIRVIGGHFYRRF